MTSEPGDLYATLGVTASATPEQLKVAWRELARSLHPDRHPDDPSASERLGEVNAAYAVLSDPEQRAQYDQYGADAASSFFDPSLVQPAPRSPPKPRPVERGEDLEVDLPLTAAEAAKGGPVDVEVEPPRRCANCEGTGWRRAGRACSKCEGGTIPGVGPFRVNVPRGVVEGQVLVLPGSGRAGRGRGAQHGDLRITVRLPASFRMHERETQVQVACDPGVLSQGGKVRVPLPTGGAVRMVVPAGSRVGQKLRLRGKGRNGGDLIAVLVAGPGQPVTVQAVSIQLS